MALCWLYIDGHFIPYYGNEKVRPGYYTQRDEMMPGQTEMFVHDSHGRIVYFEIQEGKGDLKEMMLRMSQEWSMYIGGAFPLIITDRESWGVEHFISMKGYRFVTWEKFSKKEELAKIPDDRFGEVFLMNEKSYQAVEEKKIYSIDLVVTSPPYGDSRTTVAYGQFSRLANQWLGYENASKLDNELMGGKSSYSHNFHNEVLDKTIEQIEQKDKKRANEVISFYRDYTNSIENVSKVIKRGGYVCYVVGNRRVKGITLQTDEITKSLFERNGFEHIETVVRNIPNKRMPLKNSPTNVVGAIDTTMNNEYIVVMRKTG
ncbi:MAG: hypothetical protein HQK79_22845 [Desulfobacterales bacterium]|nr:hypothetical protein [Desulfobacterales bacterium]